MGLKESAKNFIGSVERMMTPTPPFSVGRAVDIAVYGETPTREEEIAYAHNRNKHGILISVAAEAHGLGYATALEAFSGVNNESSELVQDLRKMLKRSPEWRRVLK